MARRDIGKEIFDGLEEIKAWRRGEKRLRVTGVDLPRAAGVQAIRRQLGLSQEQFAALMGVSVGTLRNWEQGRREPQGPARSLLLVASREPAAVLKALAPDRRSDVQRANAPGVAQRPTRYRALRRA